MIDVPIAIPGSSMPPTPAPRSRPRHRCSLPMGGDTRRRPHGAMSAATRDADPTAGTAAARRPRRPRLPRGHRVRVAGARGPPAGADEASSAGRASSADGRRSSSVATTGARREPRRGLELAAADEPPRDPKSRRSSSSRRSRPTSATCSRCSSAGTPTARSPTASGRPSGPWNASCCGHAPPCAWPTNTTRRSRRDRPRRTHAPAAPRSGRRRRGVRTRPARALRSGGVGGAVRGDVSVPRVAGESVISQRWRSGGGRA